MVMLCTFVAFAIFNSPPIANFLAGMDAQSLTSVSLMASPLVITFAKDIQENLYPDNEFYKQSRDDSAWIDGKTVRLPQAGAVSRSQKNRNVLPAQVKKRDDTAEEYDIDEFTTDPILIQDTEAMQLSFLKRASVLTDLISTLNTDIADNYSQIWMPTLATNIVRSSGGSVAATSPGATGTRKAIADADLIAAITLMDRMEVPANDRFMGIPTDLYAQLLALDKFVDYQKRGLVDLVSKGWIGEIYNCKIYKRSRFAIYDNTGTPIKKAYDAAPATTDNQAVLLWQKSMVRRAEGEIKVFEMIDDPGYYGSIFSALVNSGGRIARTDQKGVISIVQTLLT